MTHKRTAVGIWALLAGAFGVHKFMLGYITEGAVMLIGSLLGLLGGLATFGLTTTIMSIVGLIEGVIYLSKSDEEFTRTYLIHKKAWF